MAELKLTEEEKADSELINTGSTSVSRTDINDYANTMEALKKVEYSMPEYSSSYDREISQLYDKIVNRQAFSYEPSKDIFYNNYKEQYQRMGENAMRDSIGRAAALTGGYGNSYAQSVGQQQYGAYLQKLGEVMPELYAAAYDRYKDEGEALMAGYEMLVERENNDYGRYRDQVADMQYRQDMATQQENLLYDRKWQSYESLMNLISSSGYKPSQEELEMTGMSQAQADALRKEFLRKNGLSEDGTEAESDSAPLSDYVMNYLYGKPQGQSKSQYKLAAAKNSLK